MVISLRPGMQKSRDELLKKLVEIQYERNDINFIRNKFRVRGDTVEIFPAQNTDTIIRVEFFGDEIDRITERNALTGDLKAELKHVAIYPASHYIVPAEKMQQAVQEIEDEMLQREEFFKKDGKLLEAQRIRARTVYDIAKELKTTPASCPAASLEVCPAPCWIISRTTFCCLSMSPM